MLTVEILENLQRYALEDSLYWILEQPTESNVKVEISWCLKQGKGFWRYRSKGAESWVEDHPANLIEYIQKSGFDREEWLRDVGRSILQQSAFARMILDNIKDLMGDEAVEVAYKQNLEFISAVKKLAESSHTVSQQRALRIIKND